MYKIYAQFISGESCLISTTKRAKSQYFLTLTARESDVSKYDHRTTKINRMLMVLNPNHRYDNSNDVERAKWDIYDDFKLTL